MELQLPPKHPKKSPIMTKNITKNIEKKSLITRKINKLTNVVNIQMIKLFDSNMLNYLALSGSYIV